MAISVGIGGLAVLAERLNGETMDTDIWNKAVKGNQREPKTTDSEQRVMQDSQMFGASENQGSGSVSSPEPEQTWLPRFQLRFPEPMN